MVFDKMATICPDFKWLGFRISDLIQNPNYLQPQPLFDHSKSGLVQISDRHCIQPFLKLNRLFFQSGAVSPAVKAASNSSSKPTEKSSKVAEKLSDPASFEKNLMASFAKPHDPSKQKSSADIRPSKDAEEIFSVDKKPHQRSKKSLHRIKIVDVDGEEDIVSTSNFLSGEPKKDSSKIELFEAMAGSEIKISTTPTTKNIETKKVLIAAGVYSGKLKKLYNAS